MLIFELFFGSFVAIVYMFVSQLGFDKRPKLSDFVLIMITVATIVYGFELFYIIIEEYNGEKNFGMLQSSDISYLALAILAVIWVSSNTLLKLFKPEKESKK